VNRTASWIRRALLVAPVSWPKTFGLVNADAVLETAWAGKHVIEKTRGVDVETEAKRPGSGVWRAFGGYETQAAIDVSRRVAQELRETPKERRGLKTPPYKDPKSGPVERAAPQRSL